MSVIAIAASLLASVLFAGQRWLYCSMVDRAVDACCCEGGRSHHDEIRATQTCCRMNEHPRPASAAPTGAAPALDARAEIAWAAPLAVVPADNVAHVRALRLPDWNGPPPRARQNILRVFLL